MTRLKDSAIFSKPKPGMRVTFSVWQNYKKAETLLESALLGPVKFLTAIEKTSE
jgi:hypothetical protein